MIIVSVHLQSARDGSITELARMHMCNDGTSAGERRNYFAKVFRGRSKEQLDRLQVNREDFIQDWPSDQVHIWNLIATALRKMGYGRRSR